MNFRHLKTSFILAGGLVVATTVAGGIWSSLTFLRLSQLTGREIQTSKETIQLASEISGSLEREDDALLLSTAGERDRARAELGKERSGSERAYQRLVASLNESAEKTAAVDLKGHLAEYRRAGDALLSTADPAAARDFYHRFVNPALRHAVGDCSSIRELNFRSIEAAGVGARDEAARSTWIVLGISAAALVISSLVALRLARSVVGPVTELSQSLDAVRTGDFDRRISLPSKNELGRLAEGFNRMAAALAEFQRLNVREVVKAKERLEATLAALPDAVFLLDSDGGIVSMSPPARKMVGDDADKVRRIYDLLLPTDCLTAIGRALKGDSSAEAPADLGRTIPISLAGRTRSMLPKVLPVSGVSGGRSGAVVVFYDVTELAKLDELRTEMVAVASHELKTPLTTLRMNLLLLQESMKELSGSQKEMFDTALLGCRELQNTVDELLDLTRIEAGQLRLSMDRVDVNALVGELVVSQSSRFDGAQIHLEYVEASSSCTVRGDAARLRIALLNILGNALKYTPPRGTVRVRVSSGGSQDRHGVPLVEISVTDTGPGIKYEYREKVFEKFFRVEHHTGGDKPGVGGAGIGLYLTRQIIEAHGGSIRCDAGENGCGTRFAVCLAAEPSEVGLPSGRKAS
ncbi:MAG TPA: ATP-binding protein [Planctomycetota bacterium]|nr:ATP-binding protein [Planctomycetota bacterium]